MRERRGFTIVELMIVSAVIVVFAAVLVATLHESVDAHDASLHEQVRAVGTVLDKHKLRNQDYPDLLANQWTDLVGNDLPTAPRNPINNWSLVASKPGSGVGWVWKYDALFATGPNGKGLVSAWYDGSVLDAAEAKGKGKAARRAKGKGKGMTP